MLRIWIDKYIEDDLFKVRKVIALLSRSMEMDEINKIWESLAPEVLDMLKTFFYTKEYERTGLGHFPPLTSRYLASKNPAFQTHFFINTGNLLNSIKTKVSGGVLTLFLTGKERVVYNRLTKLRPIVPTHRMYLANKAFGMYIRVLKQKGVYLKYDPTKIV